VPFVRAPDGRSLELEYDPGSGEWTARFAEANGRAVTGRWLLKVVSELLKLPDGEKPQWVRALVRDAAGHDTPLGRRYACPCCEFLTLTEPPTGTFAICPVCRWEDDNVQFEHVDGANGANDVSLREARANFRRYRVSDPRHRERARPPRREETPPPPSARA
jgi:hypothetical protein